MMVRLVIVEGEKAGEEGGRGKGGSNTRNSRGEDNSDVNSSKKKGTSNDDSERAEKNEG